jgi:hypothetical protein
MTKTSVQPNVATIISSAAYTHSGRVIRSFQRAAIALPTAKPAMKLDKISAADQTEFPNTSPLIRSQSVSNRSALHPDRKSMSEIEATRTGEDSIVKPIAASVESHNRAANYPFQILVHMRDTGVVNGCVDSNKEPLPGLLW